MVASAGGRLEAQLAEVGIPHETIPMDSRSPVAMFRAYLRLRAVLVKYGIGLVHAHARIPAWVTSLAIRGQPIPFVTTYHGVYNAGFPWRYLTTFGERTIAVSDDVRRHLIGPLGAPAGQIRVIPNGFDLKQFHPGVDIAPLLAEFAVQAAGPHVVNAGRLDAERADVALALLAALPQLDRRVPGVRLWILGDGERGGEVRQKAEETNRLLGRRAAVATGARVDVSRFFNLADCVVAVARTAVEAMACGRPVLIAGEGGYRGLLTPELLDDWSRTNFTAREGGVEAEPDRLAEDIARLLGPEAARERQQLGAAGRDYVAKHYSIEAVVSRTLNVYAEVL